MPAPSNRRNARVALLLSVVLVAMIGLSFAAVPLYRLFCQVTGYGGTTQVSEAEPESVSDRRMTIRFNADISADLPWRFKPKQRAVEVQVGEPTLAHYEAENQSDGFTAGTATFNVTPAKAGVYFNKVDCFCFTEQTLAAGERADMPVRFFVDPAIAEDPALDDVDTITLSYTFFPDPDAETPSGNDQTAAAQPASKAPSASLD